MICRDRKESIKFLQKQFDQEKRVYFNCLGDKGQYSYRQKEYAFQHIEESGVRATAKVLLVSRRTLQRWCRKYSVYVNRCPAWVFDWAKRRRKRREFWALRGYS